ncbi:MAG: metallo-mystery pair system four-Cys motif protein [Hyphomicrobiales bacterium]|nr:metallo-mystery pair system four-Cys motif protein [Hyphomicrobiales bacterium]
MRIKFAAEFGGKPFSCASKADSIGSAKTSVLPADFRLFVSNVALVDKNGNSVPVQLDQDGKWQYRNLALLDFENGAGACANGTADMRNIVTGKVPLGQYKGLRFEIGVPFEMNHQDPTLARSPLNLTSMFWTWQGGYKFIRIDMLTSGKPAMKGGMKPAMPHSGAMKGAMKGHGHSGGQQPASGFSIHLGSTMCKATSRTSAPTSCANGNRIAVEYKNFDPAKNVVVFDPAPVVAQVDVSKNTSGTSAGCMSFPNDPECNAVMPQLGLAYGGHAAKPQAFAKMR